MRVCFITQGKNEKPKKGQSFLFHRKQKQKIKKSRAVKENAKKLHGSCHAETVAIFLQSPCRFTFLVYELIRQRFFLIK